MATGPRLTRLQDRLVMFFVVLLMAVQLGSFLFIRYAIQQTAQNTMRDELGVGSRVFRRLLEQNSQQLVEATAVLAYDFGFREAIATRDRETILSALTNHAARIKASGMAVIGLDNIVVGDTLREASAGKPYPFTDLIDHASETGRASAVRIVDGKAFQIIVVPVLAPLPIAWVSMSFLIDDSTARDLQRLANSEVSFVYTVGSEPRLLATTLPPWQRKQFLAIASNVTARGAEGITVMLGDDEYLAIATPIEGAGSLPIHAILLRSSADGLKAYFALEVILLFIAGFSLAVTLFGAVRIARRITKPLSGLGEAAREIELGNYAVRVGDRGNDEIGDLGRAFDRMAQGLSERDNMRDVLGKVASSEVVSQLLEKRIELGGEERDVTVMFTDIRNFTGIAETLTPHQSLQMLNEFLTVISAVVEEHGGVVDKYMGDGAMALFGAPITRYDDAQRAVVCALEIRKRLDALGPALAARGLPHPQVGVGVNTSRVIAGNIGSPSRLNYTVLGDGVNLASRLEGLTKRYHVPIVVGERTSTLVRGIEFRELDKVRVRGRTNAERIFEPLGAEGSLAAWDVQYLQKWRGALELFRSQRWDEASRALEALVNVRGYERLVSIYFGYMKELRANPPGADWDAAFTLYEK